MALTIKKLGRQVTNWQKQPDTVFCLLVDFGLNYKTPPQLIPLAFFRSAPTADMRQSVVLAFTLATWRHDKAIYLSPHFKACNAASGCGLLYGAHWLQ
jgi:hypothetical protein